ncbi:MAG: GTPase HflX, partial [Ruminococcus sp.]|nr:GTPase HflX [Ruminococcus sp.]
AEEEMSVTEKLLAELECADIPRINVLNKCDKLFGAEHIPEDDTTVKICAKTGAGFDRLLETIAKNLPSDYRRMALLIPYDRAGLVNEIIESGGKVFAPEYREDGTYVDALVSNRLRVDGLETVRNSLTTSD